MPAHRLVPVVRAFGAPLAVLIAVLIAMQPASAQTIYRVRMPDGSIIYTDRPPPDGVILDQREPGAAPAAPTAPAPKAPPGEAGKKGTAEVDQRLRARQQALDAANAEVTAAQRAVEAAQRRLAVESEPREGDLVGTAGGGMRPRPEFEARVQALRADLAAAEARLAKAYEARTAAR